MMVKISSACPHTKLSMGQNDFGVNNTKKELTESKKSPDDDQVTPAGEKQKGNEREAVKTADRNVAENIQQSKVQPPFNSASQRDTGNESVEVEMSPCLLRSLYDFKEHFFSRGCKTLSIVPQFLW